MSEADSSSLDRAPSEATVSPDSEPVVHPGSSVAASEVHPPDPEWHTVDFPGAISLDAIPLAVEAADIEADTEVDKPELDRTPQETAELRDRLAQLEQDFTQAQIEWQLETARLLHQVSESTPPEQAQAVQTQLSTAQEQLGRLFQELELSHQTAQRQQILVETLTEQLESSQERIAELERDCATAQQRYNEQVQQRLQAESDCRDLRIRLNRQQQHTLQFKVALEKCLEMPTTARVSADSVLLSDSSPIEPIAAPQNSPVQPWSAPANQAGMRPLFPSLSGLGPSHTEPIAASPEPLQNSTSIEGDPSDAAELMNLIFPSPSSAPTTPEAAIAPPPNSIFDISPLLAEAADEAVDSAHPIQESGDLLWQDLEHLLQPPAGLESATGEEELDRTSAEAIAAALPNVVLSPPSPGEGAKDSVVSPLPLGQSPSPVVYPLRPAKKRQSLAAVELPNFPRKP